MKSLNLSRRNKLWIIATLATVTLTGCGQQYLVLDPKGPVGEIQYNLIVTSAILMGIVILPVLIFFAYVVYRYRARAGNKAPYEPKWADSKLLEGIWWGIPIVLIGVLSYITVRDTFRLDEPPTKNVKPLTIQVVSLDWKWLFQYPDQKIATVNYFRVPTGVPVRFELTADAPINSFWIPQLGGQKYTLPGIKLQLWLQADESGKYFGTGANFTGEGFTDMKFQVVAQPQAEFDKWVQKVKQSSPPLTVDGYEKLRQQSVVGEFSYSSFPPSLFEEIVDKNGGRYYRRNQHSQNEEQAFGKQTPTMQTPSGTMNE